MQPRSSSPSECALAPIRADRLTTRRIGLKLAIADVDEAGLRATAAEVEKIVGEVNVLSVPTDVSKLEQVERLRDKVYEAWGEVSSSASRAASRTSRRSARPRAWVGRAPTVMTSHDCSARSACS